MMSSAVITPASLPSSSTTGKRQQVVLVEQFGDAVLLLVHGHLDQRFGGQILERRRAGRR